MVSQTRNSRNRRDSLGGPLVSQFPSASEQRMLRQRWSEGGRGGFWRQLNSNGTDAPY